MGLKEWLGKVFNKSPTKDEVKTVVKMITERGNGVFVWDEKLFKSDFIRAVIRPTAKAVGKLQATHIRQNGGELSINPEPYMRFLLSDPNPLMSGQIFREKLITQLLLNGNAFAQIIYNEYALPAALYPINCVDVQVEYKNGVCWLKFSLANGKMWETPYDEVIHLRTDIYGNDLLGTNPVPALLDLMNVLGNTDKGIINAIKNSGVIRWLLKYTSALRPEDLKANVKSFVDNYLSVESDTFGAAGVDAKADVVRIEPKDYVPNAAVMTATKQRIYDFFNTNEKIVNSEYTEDEWGAFYDAVVQPIALQMSEEFTRKLFTRRERGFGNKIVFEADILQCASLKTKLNLERMVDRGAMLVNEWRATLYMGPIEGGDVPIRRLDTAEIEYAETEVSEDEES